MGKLVSAAVFGILAAGVIAPPVLSEGPAHLTTANDSARGMTWGVRKQGELPPNTVDVHCHGDPKVDPRYAHQGSCNPYQGDASCSVRLPLLCFKSDGSAPPAGVVRQDFYNGWAGGQVAITAPTAGTALTSAERADAFCRSALGSGWRMAEFHDGKGGWGFVARGHISSPSRFWVRINDQPGNCWDSGRDTAARTETPQPPEPSRIKESEALSRAIEHQLAEAKPAAALPLTEANQALRQALAAQAARLGQRADEWASVIGADSPKDSKKDTATRDELSQQKAKIRQALASARIAQLDRCGRVEEAGHSALICDGQVDLVDTCGQPQRVRDLLVFQQQGGTWIAGDSIEVLQKAVHECRDRH